MAVLGIVSILLTGCSLDSCSAEEVVDDIKEAINETVGGVKDIAEDTIGSAQDDIGIKIFDIPELNKDYIDLFEEESTDIEFINREKGSKIKWKTSNKKVICLEKKGEFKRKVVALKKGKAQIIAIVRRPGKKDKTYKCKVTVSAAADIDYHDVYNMKKDGFCFTNNRVGFGYPDPYYIPYEIYSQIFYNVFPHILYNNYKEEWDGNCFGMSVGSVMIQKNLVPASDFIKGGTINSKAFSGFTKYRGEEVAFLDPTSSMGMDNLANLIERYQLSHRSVEYEKMKVDLIEEYNYSSVERRAQLFDEVISNVGTNKEPYVVIVSSWFCGHAMVVDPSRSVEVLGNNWYRLHLYDPNEPYITNKCYKIGGNNNLSLDRYIDLNTVTGHWRTEMEEKAGIYVPVGNVKSVEYPDNCGVYFIKAEDCVNVWDNKVHLFKEKVDWDQVLIETGLMDVMIKNIESHTVFWLEDGKIKHMSKGVALVPYCEGNVNDSPRKTIALPEGQYTVEVGGKGKVSFRTNVSEMIVETSPGMTIKTLDENTINIKSSSIKSGVDVLMVSGNEEKISAVDTELKIGPRATTISATKDDYSIKSGIEQTVNLEMENYESGIFSVPNVKIGNTATTVRIEKKMKKIKKLKVRKKGRNGVTVSWKTDGGSRGYEIRYATDVYFTGSKSKITSKNRTTLKKLKRGQTYYIQVRGWQKSGSARKYGNWSKVKKIKI